MSLWMQTLLVFSVLLLIMGYFQYRRSHDVLAIIQEMFRPGYLIPATIGAIAYLILKVVASIFDRVL